MNTEAARTAMKALLTRASEWEARRQVAERDQDWPNVARAETELRQLWRAYADLERQIA